MKPTPSPETPPPSVAAIVASVEKPSTLLAAETELSSLRQQRDELMVEIRSLASDLGDLQVERRLAALHSRRAALEEQIRSARARRRQALEPHLRHVRAGLAPLARDTAADIHAALAGLDAALQRGAEIVAASGCHDLRPPLLTPYQVDQIEGFAKQLEARR